MKLNVVSLFNSSARLCNIKLEKQRSRFYQKWWRWKFFLRYFRIEIFWIEFNLSRKMCFYGNHFYFSKLLKRFFKKYFKILQRNGSFFKCSYYYNFCSTYKAHENCLIKLCIAINNRRLSTIQTVFTKYNLHFCCQDNQNKKLYLPISFCLLLPSLRIPTKSDGCLWLIGI